MAMVPSNPETKPTEIPEETSQQGGGGKGEETGGYTVCLQKFAVDGVGGAVLGSIFGIGSGLVKRKSFKESLVEGGSSAKNFAIVSGVHSFVLCLLKKIRGKDDGMVIIYPLILYFSCIFFDANNRASLFASTEVAINAGIAGCATGLAISVPGTPQTLLQGCLGFGAFSFIIEEFNKRQVAIALPLSRSLKQPHNSFPQTPFPVLPPFTLPPFFNGQYTSSRNCKR